MQRKVKLGVIGAGAFSAGHLDGIDLADNCETVAVCDIDLKKAQEKAEKFHIPSVYTDYHELLKREDIEAVTVPLPDQLHRQITVDALKAGKHVLCEKPLAPTPEQAERLYAAAEEYGVVLMEAFAYLHSPYMQALKEDLANGVIGVEWTDAMPDGTKALTELLKRGIVDGTIHPFRRKIISQDGVVRNDGSSAFSPETILHMDWLCGNVDGSIPAYGELTERGQSIVRLQGIYRDQIPPQKEGIIL